MSQLFMQRALDLALLGQGKVAPNPMVGCVIVKDGQVIGEGLHQQYGGPHAEVNAVADAGEENVQGSTVYVSLEPCAHYGKTPPCADLLARIHPAKVVIANTDPNPLVAGMGIRKLQEAGIEVNVGVLADKGRVLNRRFFTFMEKKRPYVLLKWAQTADHFVARENYDSKWISNPHSRKLVHQWRSEEAAIMVGYQTAMHDNPQLTTRDWPGKNPTRIVLDPKGTLPSSLHLFDGSVTTLLITSTETPPLAGATNLCTDNWHPASILDLLYQQKILSVMIEGGSATLQKFIDTELWDEARVFTSDITFGAGIKAPQLSEAPKQISDIFGDKLEFHFK